MIRINLLPTKEKAQAASQRQELSLVGLLLLLVLVAFGGIRFQQAHSMSLMEQEIGTLQQSLAVLEPRVKEVSDIDQKRKELDAKLKVIADLGNKRVGPALVLAELGRATPDRAWLTEFSELRGAATLTGNSVDNQTIADFLRGLSSSPYFTNVDLVETTAQALGEMKLRKFILKAQINYAAAGKKEAPASAEAAKPAEGPHG